MKTYNLIIAKTFPKTHIRQGELTEFHSNIRKGIKKHTIRKNYPFWETRFESLNKGTARIALKEWIGKPYMEPQLELQSLTTYEGIGLQKLSCNNGVFLINDYIEVTME